MKAQGALVVDRAKVEGFRIRGLVFGNCRSASQARRMKSGRIALSPIDKVTELELCTPEGSDSEKSKENLESRRRIAPETSLGKLLVGLEVGSSVLAFGSTCLPLGDRALERAYTWRKRGQFRFEAATPQYEGIRFAILLQRQRLQPSSVMLVTSTGLASSADVTGVTFPFDS